ncbi:MAG TPA: hypothetical protein ENK18_20955, partial [Deltaproteobacteria bacterium]|nr:hypothetical protein [Deltaproteobacteria bacterium]
RHDWRRGTRGHTEIPSSSDRSQEAVLYGELRMLLGGATSIAGSSSEGEGLMRNLDDAALNEGLGGWEVGYETFPLGDIDGDLYASGCDGYYIDPPWVLDDRIYLPHISEGIDAEANNEFRCLSGIDPGGEDLIADNTSIIHGIGLTTSDVAEVSREGAHLVWSPRSNVSLYGETAQVVLYDNLAVPIALGTDWVPSGSGTLLRELQCADQLNRDQYGGHFSDRDLWLMVTRNAAVATGSDGQLGRLREGFIADVAIFAKGGAELHRAVIEADIPDVQLVLRGSEPLTGDADLISGLLSPADYSACEALDDCVSEHVVCMDTLSLAAVEAAVGGGAYDLTICGVPAGEPTCVPLREDEDGDGLIYPVSTLNDLDQDGVEDSVDNCVDVFNPGRPVDGYVQTDVDGDSIGDACDRCPMDPGGACTWLDPDGDGIEGLDDNCPGIANADQADTDNDLLGDACDACPDFWSPQGACLESVYDLKQGLLAEGQSVVLGDMLVTAVSSSGVYMQLSEDAASYAGPDYSGIYAYMPSIDPKPVRGDIIQIDGVVNDFNGQLQLSSVAGWSLQSAGEPDPSPVVAGPADVQTGGLLQWPLESVVVSVEDVTVTSLDLAPGPGDDAQHNEFEVDGGLRIDDQLYSIEPYPALGERFASLTGVLRYGNGDSKLEPRDASDVVAGAPTIESLDPEVVYVESGITTDQLLTVRLIRVAGQDEVISLSCAPAPIVSCPATVTVPSGDQEAAVEITSGLASQIPAVVTATLNGSNALAEVYVYDDASPRSVVALSPDPMGIAPDTVAPMAVTLDLPAASGGAVVDLAASNGLVSVPATVTVPAGELEAVFDVTAGPNQGAELITASLGGSFTSAVVDVDPASVGVGLIFSEYLEGSTGTNKYVEIKNVDPLAIDLSTCEVNVYSNGAASPSNTIALSAAVLANGDLFLLCNSSATFSTYAPCDQSSGSLNFNGNDAVDLICGGITQDVIGQIGFDPGSTWGSGAEVTRDGVLRRDCAINMGDTDGSDPFDPAVEWIGGITDDASELGLDTCP